MPKAFDYLIVGGGIAGTTAAETIRQNDTNGSIAIVSDEPHRLYSRLLLSKPSFFLGRTPFNQIWLKDEAWYVEQRVDRFFGKAAVGINVNTRTIELDEGTKLQYGKLLLAPGGSARRWPLEGEQQRGIFHLRTLDDAKAIMQALKTAKSGVVIGGGFISFEMCDMMKLAGLKVTVLLRGPHYWSRLLDEKSGTMIEQALQRGGVKIVRNVEVSGIVGENAIEKIRLSNGEEILADMVVVGIGAVYPFGWLKEARLNIGLGILTNEYLETNIPDVWAAGDAAEFHDIVLGEHIQLGNWVNAQMQGRRAGLNMLEPFGKLRAGREPFRLVSFYTTQGFGMTIAFVGDVRPLPGRIILMRGTPEDNSYARMFIVKNEVIGAMLINRTQELGSISKFIERDINIAVLKSQIQDPSIPLASLLPK